MKVRKIFVCAIFALIYTAGVFAQSGKLTIAEALDKASRQFSGNLKDGTIVAILGISSGTDALDEYMLDEFTADIVSLRKLKVVTRANLDVIKKEMNFQLSGEVSDETMQRLGAKTGAETVIAGTFKNYGTGYRLNIQAFNVTTAAIQDIYRSDIQEDDILSVLLKKKSVRAVKKEVEEKKQYKSLIELGFMQTNAFALELRYCGVFPFGLLLKGGLAGISNGNGSILGVDIGAGYAFVNNNWCILGISAGVEGLSGAIYYSDGYEEVYNDLGFGTDLFIKFILGKHFGIYSDLGLLFGCESPLSFKVGFIYQF